VCCWPRSGGAWQADKADKADDGWRPLGSAAVTEQPGLLPAGSGVERARPLAQAPEQPGAQPGESPPEEEPEGNKTEAHTPAESEPEAGGPPPVELKPELAALRDRVRPTLAAFQRDPLDAGQHSPTELIDACLPFGCRTELLHRGVRGGKINGITCLCWNYPCAGYTLLTLAQGRIAARLGYGFQQHRGQLLAMLAFARVKPDYPLRVGEEMRSVADLVEYEKLACRSGTEMSWTLVGLTRYAADQTWQNDLGETWSVERIVGEELSQPIVEATDGGTHRLLGLSYAVRWQQKHDKPLTGQFDRAAQFLRQFEDHALSAQNADGSWGPSFFAARSASRDPRTQLYATGHVLRWLAYSLPEERLSDPRVVRSVDYLNRLVAGQSRTSRSYARSTRELHGLMCGLHALAIYDQRVFQPADPPAQPAAHAAPKTATR